MIHHGYTPGLLGWTVAEHARHYATHWGFGSVFEIKVAQEMSAFVARLESPGNHIWWAGTTMPVATISLDGQEASLGMARIRWFYASDAARGTGLGRQLLSGAIDQARHDGATGLWLTTFSGLDAARHLYEAMGLRLVEETEGPEADGTEAENPTWGTPVREQRFEMRF